MKNFNPFANETDAVAIEDLHVENREDRVTVYGNIDLTRDQEGLKKALALKSLLDAVVQTLQGEPLPAKVATKPPGTTKNPFA